MEPERWDIAHSTCAEQIAALNVPQEQAEIIMGHNLENNELGAAPA